MTAKSRRRKLTQQMKRDSAKIKTYRFLTNSKEVHIPAESLEAAKTKFQERFGYWPK